MIVLEFSEGNELDDVTRHLLSIVLRVKRSVITIKCFHAREVEVSDTDNDDGERLVGATYDLVDGLFHISNGAIGQYQEQVILLIVLRNFFSFAAVIYVRYDF